MWTAWHEIPTPEGCGACHHQTISGDWQVAYQPPNLSDETGRVPWQQPASVAPPTAPGHEQPTLTKDQPCFRCHREPDSRHRDYSGTYQHQPR
jgi:hypothetical protein